MLCPFESIPTFTQQLTQTFEPELASHEDEETALTPAVPSILEPVQPAKRLSLVECPPKSQAQLLAPANMHKGEDSAEECLSSGAADLPSPDSLLQRPPYYLTLTQAGSGIEVSSSHSPSLTALEQYLSRWSSVSQPPSNLTLKLHSCSLQKGRFASLTIGKITVPVVATIVEKLLGYELRHACGAWTFVRATEFE